MSENNHAIVEWVAIKAPCAAVFKALTDAGELMKWFPTRVQSDARAGGKFRFEWDFNAAEQNGSQEGTYLEVTPNQKVSYGWQAGMNPAVPTTVTFELAGEGDETTVTLNHAGFGDGPDAETLRSNHAGPWHFYMQNLKSYLEDGKDGRAAALGQKTT
jgi:uncharacterized protein YndB with AHSA1/START domain